jgi:hypothetical protein
MIDQRDQRRRVVSDGQQQVHGEGQHERPLAVESWGTASSSSGEQRGIRLLADSGATRAPVRLPSAPGRAGHDEADHARADEPAARPVEDQHRNERARRLRCDETHTHALGPNQPQALGGRTPGPLSARIAQRQLRGPSEARPKTG